MIIKEEWFGNDYTSNLIITNYPNLQSIIVKKQSLKYLNSLKICNCDKLKTIEIEDGEGIDSAFVFVQKLEIESRI